MGWYETATKEPAARFYDIDAVIAKSQDGDRVKYVVGQSVKQVELLFERPPRAGETYRAISGKGGFTSCDLIMYLAKNGVEELYASTLRVGVKQALAISNEKKLGRIKSASIVTSDMQQMLDSAKYDYYAQVCEIFEKAGIEMIAANNHAKVIIAKSGADYFVVETSSNLNENPKIEQFVVSNSEETYRFYLDYFSALRIALG